MLDEKLFKKIREITIPEYITQVQISRSRRAKYFHRDSGIGKKKVEISEIPKKHKATGYDLQGYAINDKNERIIANSISVGKPRFVPINGQQLYSQNGGKFSRSKIVNELHSFYTPFIIAEAPFKQSEYPLVLQVNWFCPYGHKTMDNTNFASIYIKTFEDTLTNNSIIQDDEVRYITGSLPIYTPCENFEDRKIVFSFYQDMRAEINQLKLL